MSKKAIKQLEQFFDLSSEPVLRQLNEVKEMLNVESFEMDEQEIEFYSKFQEGLEIQYELEQQTPLSHRVYNNLISKMPEKEVAKILNVMTSDNYQLFFQCVDETVHEQAKNVLKIIDDGIEAELDKKSMSIH